MIEIDTKNHACYYSIVFKPLKNIYYKLMSKAIVTTTETISSIHGNSCPSTPSQNFAHSGSVSTQYEPDSI